MTIVLVKAVIARVGIAINMEPLSAMTSLLALRHMGLKCDDS